MVAEASKAYEPHLRTASFELAGKTWKILTVQTKLNELKHSLVHWNRRLRRQPIPDPLSTERTLPTRLDAPGLNSSKWRGVSARSSGCPGPVGQVYGLLPFSPALALDEIADQLSISKTSVSTGTRQARCMAGDPAGSGSPGTSGTILRPQETFGASPVLYSILFPKPRQDGAKTRSIALLSRRSGGGFCFPRRSRLLQRERLAHLVQIQSRASKLLPLVEKLL